MRRSRCATCAGVVSRSPNSPASAGGNHRRRGNPARLREPPEARQLDVIGEKGGFFKVDTTEAAHRLTTQTFFLEPLESPVLFAAPRVVALQGALPSVGVAQR